MQRVVWSETRLDGGRHFEGPLPPPPANAGFYRDIAVLAWPTPPGELKPHGGYRIAELHRKTQDQLPAVVLFLLLLPMRPTPSCRRSSSFRKTASWI